MWRNRQITNGIVYLWLKKSEQTNHKCLQSFHSRCFDIALVNNTAIVCTSNLCLHARWVQKNNFFDIDSVICVIFWGLDYKLNWNMQFFLNIQNKLSEFRCYIMHNDNSLTTDRKHEMTILSWTTGVLLAPAAGPTSSISVSITYCSEEL